MNRSILTGEHISKKYGNTTVLLDVSIHIKEGSIYGLIGRNGSGKTTLLRILCGLIPDYGGKITLAPMGQGRCSIGAVISSPGLFLNMTAFENLKEQAALLGLRDDNKISAVLKTVGLEEYADKTVKGFSLGMTQRLKLGMSLLESPELLILDEPVNGLDPDGIADLRSLLHRLNREQGMTILISSHILSELESTADFFGILTDGVIAAELSADDLKDSGTTLEQLYMQYTKGGYVNA